MPTINTDWSAINSIEKKQWMDGAISSDGNKLYAIAYEDYIYLSHNKGASWSTSGGIRKWNRISCSSDGTKLIATAGSTSPEVFISTNSGLQWSNITTTIKNSFLDTTNTTIKSVDISPDGSKLIVCSRNKILISTDNGASWTTIIDSGFFSQSSSFNILKANNTKIVVGEVGSGTLVSSTLWNSRPDGRIFIFDIDNPFIATIYTPTYRSVTWSHIEISSDSNTILATSNSDYSLWITKDGGLTWNQINPKLGNNSKAYFRGTTLSNDANKLFIASSSNLVLEYGRILSSTHTRKGLRIPISIDGGNSWSFVGPKKVWKTIVCSSNGDVALALPYTEYLYISTNTQAQPQISPSPTQTLTPTNTPSKTPTRTPTKTPTPTPTPTLTPSETACPAPSPTPSPTPNLKLNDCLIHTSIHNLVGSHRYESTIKTDDYDKVVKIVPNKINFIAKEDGVQDLSFLISRLEASTFATLSIRTIDLDTGLEDNRVVVVTNNNCGCNTVACPDTSPTPTPSPGVITTVNYNGCLRCDNPDFITAVSTVGTNGRNSYYGTFDQNGNVWEWTDNGNNTQRYLRGGSYASSNSEIDSYSLGSRKLSGINTLSSQFGFRVASYSNPNNLRCMVSVGNTCNNPNTNGFGRVKYQYFIHKYPVTNYEYMGFLNSVAFDTSSDRFQLYKEEMSNDPNGGIIRTYNNIKGRYEYSIKPNMMYKPVNFIRWIDAIRYVNWLHNDFGNTEDGAYKINSTNVQRNHGAKYFIPNENEWYKAAYFNATDNKYYRYATQSNKQPLCPKIDIAGNGPFVRDTACDCPQIEICDVVVADATLNNDRIFILDMLKNPNCCCNVQYKIQTADTVDLYVDSSENDWLDTGIDILINTSVKFQANGTVYYDIESPEQIPLPTSGPNGISTNLRSCKIDGADHLPSIALIAKIGQSGPAFLVGSRKDIIAQESGRLYLAINDTKCAGSDNSGYYYVNIKYEPPIAEWQNVDPNWIECNPYQLTLRECSNLIP